MMTERNSRKTITYEQAEKENDAMVQHALAQSRCEILRQARHWESARRTALAIIALYPTLNVEKVYDVFHDQLLWLIQRTGE